MAKCKFINVKISSIITVVPPDIKGIDDEVDNYGGNASQIDRIKKTIGLDRRHVVDAKTTTLDLCLQAAQETITANKIDVVDIDGLIVVTQTPDHFQPSNSSILHGLLNLTKDCAAYDVNIGCSGYVYGLWLSHMMIASGTCTNVLLLAGDTISKNVNPRDRTVAPLFGDAGSATLIQKSNIADSAYFSLHTDGKGRDAIKIPAGGFRQPTSDVTLTEAVDENGSYRCANDLHMNGIEVFSFSMREEPPAIKEILRYAGASVDDIDYYLFHQANKYIVTSIAKHLEISIEKVPVDTVSKYGNQSSASIPATINDALTTKTSSQKLNVVMSGFGVGLSWASCLIKLDKIHCPPVMIYNEHLMTSE